MNGYPGVGALVGMAGRGGDADDLARVLATLRLGLDLLAEDCGDGPGPGVDHRSLIRLLAQETERLIGLVVLRTA